MNDRTDKEAGKAGQSHESRDPAGVGATGHDRAGGGVDATPMATNSQKALNSQKATDGKATDGSRAMEHARENPNASDDAPSPDPDGVADQAADVEAGGSLIDARWTRRALAGGVVLAVGGLLFGLSRTGAQKAGTRASLNDGGMVPMRAPAARDAVAPESVLPEVGEHEEAPPAETATTNPAETEPARIPAQAQRPHGPAQIAIVIDDLGLRQEETRWATSLPGPLTLAFLPYGQSLAAHARRAAANGHEVILHLPMDPGGRADPGPQALRVGQDRAELERRLGWNMAQVPGIQGVNNHMGSALTENAAAMEAVLTRLKAEGRYFLDSRTTAKSAARSLADRMEVPYAERDVFLDNDTSPQAIARQLAETEDLARRYGSAIAIGHPHRQTLKALETWVSAAQERGFNIVPVSTIIATRGSALWRLARDRKSGAKS